jgi:hypothetical protein
MNDKTQTADPTDRDVIVDSIIGHIHHLSKLSLEELEHILDCLTTYDEPIKEKVRNKSEPSES